MAMLNNKRVKLWNPKIPWCKTSPLPSISTNTFGSIHGEMLQDIVARLPIMAIAAAGWWF